MASAYRSRLIRVSGGVSNTLAERGDCGLTCLKQGFCPAAGHQLSLTRTSCTRWTFPDLYRRQETSIVFDATIAEYTSGPAAGGAARRTDGRLIRGGELSGRRASP
ncbi:hypothetical protein EVAR_94244_1 [Eumeta japonica]|uniref:Uncharacterized protein n=1 Tax=Eumeta variegata TaxID=151549 RepID=A0A4C1UNS0_EUMVA|nr:hypothetical protein EVAR_94244_1 [Eumeta japonica]